MVNCDRPVRKEAPMSKKYYPSNWPFHAKHPWVCNLYWFPPIWLVGIFVSWSKPWCKVYLSMLIVELQTPVHMLWWPAAMYRHYKQYTR